MFTGIVSGIGKIKKISELIELRQFCIAMPQNFLSGLQRGASIAIDGVCLTVIDFNLETAVQDNKVMQDFELESLPMGADHSQTGKAAPIGSDYDSKDCVNLLSSTAVSRFNLNEATFDAISETLQRTTLKNLQEGDLVNLERAARFGDEIGGHILSGHIFGTVKIDSINQTENHYAISFKCPTEWTKYLFKKGYVALNGVSLTLVDVDKAKGLFSVHLIPETLEKTTFKTKKINDLVNLEIETQTQTIVDTLESIYQDSMPVNLQAGD